MKKIPLLACLVVICSISVSAQVQRISGKVIDDSTGIGLPNVSVIVSGTTKGTTTAADGVFVLSFTPDGKKHNLLVSNSGYISSSQPLDASTEGLTVRLKTNSRQLEDVVVIGYQTVKRRDLLASVSSVGSKDLHDIPLNSAEESLAGRLAGVQVTGAEGSPNAQVFIRVRGGGSITQNNAPLYVVDGVQVDNALSTLSPQDIESIDVLKDAAATAIYGARGSNGVVIVTTKGGRNTGGRTSVTYNGFVGFQNLEKKLPVQDPYDFMYYQYERYKQTGDTTFLYTYGYTWDTIQHYKNVPAYDWQKKMLGRHAFQQTHNVSVNGGTEQTQYNLSVTANRADAIMLLSDYDRKLVAFRFDHRASDKLRIGANVRFNNTVIDGAGTSNPGTSGLNFLRQIIRYRPFLVPGQSANTFDPSYYGETNNNGLNLVNPVLLNNAQYRKSTNNILDLNLYANYSFSKAFSFRSTFGFDYNNLRADAFDDTLTSNSHSNGANMPIASINNTVLSSVDNSNVFTYTNAASTGHFKDHNALTVILGEETYQTKENDNFVQTNYFPVGTTASAALANMNLGSPAPGGSEPKPTSNILNTSLLSFFGRVTYAYDRKYLFSASARADASSLFAQTNRWGYFPAASAAWRISQESFMDRYTWISDLKLRVAYGQAGNNRISPYQYITQFNTNSQYALSNGLTTAFAPAGLANPDLKWESTTSRNIGLDASLFRDRFGFSVDVYSNTTSNLLIAAPVPTTSGYTSQVQNVGSTSNKGVEVQLTGTIFQNRKFSWTSSFNISFNQNKIRSLGAQQSYLQNSNWAGSANPPDFIVKVGQAVGTMWGLVNDGYYKISDFTYNTTTRAYTLNKGIANSSAVTGTVPMPGGQKFKALNGDTAVTANSRTIIGNAQPKFFGGLNQNFSFHGFDMSIFINFQYGNKVYNYNKLEFTSGYTSGANLLGVMKDRWHTVDANGVSYETVSGTGAGTGASPDSLAALNKNAKIWIPSVGASATAFQPQSWALEDASFIRINNITVGYSLPASVIQKLKIARLRVYATVNNVAVIAGYSGYDPEVNTRTSTPVTPGVDYSAYPRSRTFITGVNVTF